MNPNASYAIRSLQSKRIICSIPYENHNKQQLKSFPLLGRQDMKKKTVDSSFLNDIIQIIQQR